MKISVVYLLIVSVILPINLLSQDVTQPQPQKKVALVIGNGNYSSSVLANPENDARSMSEVLQKLGFTVFKYENLSQVQMKKAIDDFGLKLKGNDVGLFFYAGHGIQSKGYNYLIPVDAQLQTEQDVEYDCVQADRIFAKMQGSGTKVNIVILDACRNNPFERSWTRSETGKGLAFMNAPKGTLIAYATSPGSTASDGSGRNGLYTSAILESILIPNITIIQMFQQVRSIVNQKSADQQTPWESTSLIGDFYFNREVSLNSRIQDNMQEMQANKITSSTMTNNESKISLNAVAAKYESGSFIDQVNNYLYKTIKIGDQIWMAENLKTGKFNNGMTIPLVINNKAWGNLKTPAYCWYNNNDSTYGNTYGALYNWYTVNDGKLCPKGWHVPSDNEWTVLTIYLGGESVAGGKLKETGTTHLSRPNIGATNETSFTALPGGYRGNLGFFEYISNYGLWWSSTEHSSMNAWFRKLGSSSSSMIRDFNLKVNGFSVRCIKDN